MIELNKETCSPEFFTDKDLSYYAMNLLNSLSTKKQDELRSLYNKMGGISKGHVWWRFILSHTSVVLDVWNSERIKYEQI